MAFQDDIAKLNELYFFREFTFSQTQFYSTPQDKVELADNVVWLGDTLLVYQIKEREVADTTPEKEEQWFKSKVLKGATGQIRETLAYLKAQSAIAMKNHRGHTFEFRPDTIRTHQKVVLYRPHKSLPASCREVRYHRSKTAGIIHIFSAGDYLGVVRTLLTPAEFADYLGFRETLIDKWEGSLARLPEQALVGQYLSGNSECSPSLGFVKYLEAVEHNTEDWDMSGVLDRFADRITQSTASTEYYPIVREIALLKRNELKEVKGRLRVAMEKAKANTFVKPYTVTFPRTGCGFVFIPLTSESLPHRRRGLQNLTHAHKYDQRLSKCVGVSLAFEGEGWYSEEWCYLEFPWAKNQTMEEMLRDNNPFRDVKMTQLERYLFKA